MRKSRRPSHNQAPPTSSFNDRTWMAVTRTGKSMPSSSCPRAPLLHTIEYCFGAISDYLRTSQMAMPMAVLETKNITAAQLIKLKTDV